MLTVQERFRESAVATYGARVWILDELRRSSNYAGDRCGKDTSLAAARCVSVQDVAQPAAVDYDPTTGKINRTARPLSFISSQSWEKGRGQATYHGRRRQEGSRDRMRAAKPCGRRE